MALATVAYHENDVKQLMVELNVFYRNLLHGDSAVDNDHCRIHRSRRERRRRRF